MKWKYIIVLFSISILSLVGMVLYYHLEWSDLTTLSFYEDLANPSVRIIQVQEGLRKEEIADIMATKLGWDASEKKQFVLSHLALNTKSSEGYFFPKTYMVNRDESPADVSTQMFTAFENQTGTITKTKSTKIVNEDTAVKIASIIQREAGGKNDMRLISGIIWNRLFNGMKLQMDATLQYAKGNEEDGWWPTIGPDDKNIDSPYNTYLHTSLPPYPIANPGLAALEAAYNPQKTNCLFYIHDKNRNIHCSTTYAQHLKNIAKYY